MSIFPCQVGSRQAIPIKTKCAFSVHRFCTRLTAVGCICSLLAFRHVSRLADSHALPTQFGNPSSVKPLTNPTEWNSLCQLAMQRTNHSCEPRREPFPRVYDVFMFNDELTMLEIRMNELKDVVDYFVIAEARMTFTAEPKRLHFHENAERFTFVADKIIHVSLQELSGETTWERERFHRNAMFEQGLSVPGKESRPGDILLTSDIDEIPRSWVIEALRRCAGFEGHIVKFDMNFFYYSYLIRARENWSVKMATFVNGEGDYPKPFDVRNAEANEILFTDAGWHCSYCFPELAQFRNKMRSFSHTELNLPKFLTQENIVRSIHSGVAFFSHVPGYFRHLNASEIDAPAYVIEHAQRFHFLLDRTSPTAGLSDYDSPGSEESTTHVLSAAHDPP